MKRILVLIFAAVAVSATAFAQDLVIADKPMTKTQVIGKLASNPWVNVTYLTKSMLSRMPKNQKDSPLSMLVGNEAVNSVRVFELGNTDAEIYGKKLMEAYIDGSPYSELLLLQRNGANDDVVIYGVPMTFNTNLFGNVLIYTKQKGKAATLIILSGKMSEETLGDLIDAFSTAE